MASTGPPLSKETPGGLNSTAFSYARVRTSYRLVAGVVPHRHARVGGWRHPPTLSIYKKKHCPRRWPLATLC